jgi:hypothetical protein
MKRSPSREADGDSADQALTPFSVELLSSLSCFQVLAIDPYSEPDESNEYSYIFFL